ncbi:hypothetical protein [Streptomyces sp. NPDC005012]|uniref:hypothetical protein n=1 Tax=Streptomyces sp. NPDC005012 TaxID=3154558 RepID=UPI00339E2338
MPRGRHRHSPPLHRLLPPSAFAAVSVVCAVVPWFAAEPLLLRLTTAVAAGVGVAAAVTLRRWDSAAGLNVAELKRAKASAEWQHEERVAELEADLEEGRELRIKLEQRLRSKRAELAALRNEHAALLRRYATAETERASALEGRRQLEIGAAAPVRELPPVREAPALGPAPVPEPVRPFSSEGGTLFRQAQQALEAVERRAAEEAALAEDAAVPEDAVPVEDVVPEGAVPVEDVVPEGAVPVEDVVPEGAVLPEDAVLEEAERAEDLEFVGGDGAAGAAGTADAAVGEGAEAAVAEGAVFGPGAVELGPDGAEGVDGARAAADDEPSGFAGAAGPGAGVVAGGTDGGGEGEQALGARVAAAETPSADPYAGADAAAANAPEGGNPGNPTDAEGGTGVGDHAGQAPGEPGGADAAGAAPAGSAPPAGGHFTVPTAVAVVPAAPAPRRPATEGGFDFFGTQRTDHAEDHRPQGLTPATTPAPAPAPDPSPAPLPRSSAPQPPLARPYTEQSAPPALAQPLIASSHRADVGRVIDVDAQDDDLHAAS